MEAVTVSCSPVSDGWRCEVSVGEGPGATQHVVSVAEGELLRYAGRADADVAGLVEASFRFLLEREPRESILRSFALPVIASYFPEYPAEIRRRIDG